LLLTGAELRLRRENGSAFPRCRSPVVSTRRNFGGRPAPNAIKGFQARRHASRAFAFIEQENWPEARVEAVAAYQLRPNEPQALRAVARFLSRTRQPDALEFWKRLAKEKPLDRDDLRDEAGIALAIGETQIAESAVKSLLADSRAVTAADELLAAQLAIQKNLPDAARPHLEKIFANANATERERLQGALLQLATAKERDDATQRSSWAQVEKLAGGKTVVSLDALTLLARRALSVAPNTADAWMPATADLVRALRIIRSRKPRKIARDRFADPC
jgi:tetratricopeptide (TPR) repeat protein